GRGKFVTGPNRGETSAAQSTQTQTPARVFALSRHDAVVAPEVVTRTLFVYDFKAYALIDHGSIHSFILRDFASHFHAQLEP
ncbi:hypothetical protein J0J37_22730, partial [Vibrio vulnificus]|uniref:hypothetical protein n=1 Tax=Vibrio vulnificus TaxID=672 RepID=UPI0019D4C25F|nr:hypothetical protein [Vibrio vulnificus]